MADLDLAELERELKFYGGAIDHDLLERALPVLLARVRALEAALRDCAESLALARDKLGLVGEGDDKDRKGDGEDVTGSGIALRAARAALQEGSHG